MRDCSRCRFLHSIPIGCFKPCIFQPCWRISRAMLNRRAARWTRRRRNACPRSEHKHVHNLPMNDLKLRNQMHAGIQRAIEAGQLTQRARSTSSNLARSATTVPDDRPSRGRCRLQITSKCTFPQRRQMLYEVEFEHIVRVAEVRGSHPGRPTSANRRRQPQPCTRRRWRSTFCRTARRGTATRRVDERGAEVDAGPCRRDRDAGIAVGVQRRATVARALPSLAPRM